MPRAGAGLLGSLTCLMLRGRLSVPSCTWRRALGGSTELLVGLVLAPVPAQAAKADGQLGVLQGPVEGQLCRGGLLTSLAASVQPAADLLVSVTCADVMSSTTVLVAAA